MANAATVSIPQTLGQYIDWNNATLSNCSVENSGANIGSTHSGSTATFTLSNTTQQEYFMTMKTGANNLTAVLTISVMKDGATLFTTERTVENTGSWTPSTVHNFSVGTLPVSDNLTLEIKVKSSTGSYAGNYGDLAIYAASQYDQIPSENNITLTAGTHSGAKYESGNDNIGYIKNGTSSVYTIYNTEDAYMNMKMDIIGFYNAGQVTLTVTDAFSGNKEAEQTFDVTAGGNGTVFSVNEPLLKGLKTVRLDYISTSTGFIMNYSHLQFNKRADYVPSAVLTLKNISVDGMSLSDEAVEALKNNGGSYTLTGNIYTSVPVVAATMSNLGGATVTPAVDGNKVVYTLTATNYEATLTVEGLHTYAKAAGENTVDLKYTSEGKSGAGNWSNGLYSLLSSSLDGWNNSSFKLNSTEYTLTMPSNIKVKQLVLKDLGNNYAGDASITSVTSEGATNIWLPTKRYALKDKNYDLIINIEGHKSGTPIIINMDKQGQPTAWIQLITEETSEGNPTLTSKSATVVDNHAVVALTFDREVKSATATFNGKQYTAEGGSTTLYFQLWDMDYSSEYTFTLLKENILDNYNNKALADAVVTINTAAKPAVTMAEYDYVVSNATELDAAIAELAVSNKTASAPRKTVFLKNGNYTYGTLTGNYQHNVSLKIDNWNSIHNVSLIGESKDGVIIEGTTDGITSSTIDLGDGVGNYLQDLTIRNNYDFRAATLKGVSVAVTGGNKTAMKNVAMQASQDTYVTGKRTYLEDCDIFGTTDFICGGGDIYFERCNLILGNKSGAVISAPNTSTDNKWGYVFQNCLVKADEGATLVTDKSWNLGRPWQNEPRAYYLNTKMEVLCSDGGWTTMGSLPTHFYEYKSVDKNGNLIDLSTRKNSPTSTNTYSPVLTDAEAAMFTLRNALCGTDSWEAIAETSQMEAPTGVTFEDGKVKWNAVDDALLYAVFLNGVYVANTTSCEYQAESAGSYTVKAANKNGGLGAESAKVYAVNTNAAGWASFCANDNVTFAEGAEAYVCTAVNDTQITLSKVTAVPAGTGVFVKGAASSKHLATVTASADVVSTNYIVGCLEDKALTGSEGAYVLGVQNGDAGLYLVNSALTVPAGKAYLLCGAKSAKVLSIAIEDDATSIDIIETANTTATSQTYNILGQKVSGNAKGLVIKNGKKYHNK